MTEARVAHPMVPLRLFGSDVVAACVAIGFAMFLCGSGCYWSPARTDVMRCVLKPSQCIRPT